VKAVLVVLAVLACLSRMHVTVSTSSGSLTMPALGWFLAAVITAAVVLLVLVIRKAVTDGPWIVPRRRTA
jgi:hypothetical protein